MSQRHIVAGLGIGLAVVAVLALPMAHALGDLWSARQQRADLEARRAAPAPAVAPLIAPALEIKAGDRTTASRRLAQQLRARAASAGVLVETLAPTAPLPGLVTLRVRMSGPEKAVIALAAEIERGVPLTRFRSWKVAALSDGGVRVEGEVVAAWR